MRTLNPKLIQNAKTGDDGKIVGGCPACSEKGHDGKKNHLVVYPDGGFGCIAQKGNKDHNRRILELIGTTIKVDASPYPRIEIIPCVVPKRRVLGEFGRLGRCISTPEEKK